MNDKAVNFSNGQYVICVHKLILGCFLQNNIESISCCDLQSRSLIIVNLSI